MPEPGSGDLLTNAASGLISDHDLLLHALDTWRPYQNPDGTIETRFYGSDVFRGTESAWEQVPVILGKRHPTTPYQVNPVKALAESEGIVVGKLSNVNISETGSPVLRSKLHLTDESAESLLKSRKMAISSGFISKIDEGKLTGIDGRVIPDHVLAFEHSRTNRPQDGAALILNNVEEIMADNDSIKSVLSEFLTELKSLLVPAKNEPVMPAMPEPIGLVPNMSENKAAELELALAESRELIKNMAAELDAFKEADKNRKADEQEKKWQLVKNSIAPGIVATPELEATARKSWETDATEFLIQNAISRPEPTAREGVMHVTNSTGGDDADKDYLEFINMTGGIRK